MKKAMKLRRLGVLLIMLGLGILIGRTGSNVPIMIGVVIGIIWMFAYDFAMEERLKNAKKSMEVAKDARGSRE